MALSIVGTPIGNLGDLSPRAVETLRAADLIACEDTRRTAVLLRHAGARAPMVALHAHNEAARSAELIERIGTGQHVVLVSDAGMPGVSDPGARLAAAAARAGIEVRVVPGPSAVTAAVALAGLGEGSGFVFLGFLPRRAAERDELIERLLGFAVPAVVFESPRRVRAFLESLAARAPDHPVVVCRELTKLHEQTLRGGASELVSQLADAVRGEITLVIGPGSQVSQPGADDARLSAGIELMLDAGLGASRAAEVAAALGASARNRAYARALEITESRRASR